MSRSLYWCLAPAALLGWLGVPAGVVGLGGGLAWLALHRSWPSLVCTLALGVLACQGGAGFGAAVFLLAAALGRVSPLMILALAWLAGGLSPGPWAWSVAGATLILGLAASVGAGLWRVYVPALECPTLRLPQVNAGWVIFVSLAVGAAALACMSLIPLARHTLELFSQPLPGRVLFSQAVPPVDTEATSRYWLDVRYEYREGSRTVESSTSVASASRSEDEARRWVREHPAGTPVTVWVGPAGATLWREIDHDELAMMLLCGLVGWVPIVGFFVGMRRTGLLAGWWMTSFLLSWPMIGLVGTIAPLYWVGGVLGLFLVHSEL